LTLTNGYTIVADLVEVASGDKTPVRAVIIGSIFAPSSDPRRELGKRRTSYRT
jgi:hypothetical protein